MASQDFSVREAASRLGVTADALRTYCKAGRLGRRLLGRYRISADELERLEAGARVSSPTRRNTAPCPNTATTKHPHPSTPRPAAASV
jgi:hypothetical protein